MASGNFFPGTKSLTTVNSRLADSPLLRTLAITITDKIQIPISGGLTVLRILAITDTKRRPEGVRCITRVDCTSVDELAKKKNQHKFGDE